MTTQPRELAPIPNRITVIDTHTGGEPTRVVFDGGPDLGSGSMADRARRFAAEFDHFRSAVVNEPRGSDVMVGALLCEPSDSANTAGVLFFNNVGVLGMCGHGTIGTAVALAHAGRLTPGNHVFETCVGNVPFTLHDDLRQVTLDNVPCYRLAKDVSVDVPNVGTVTGDVAWGGNWFFLVHGDPAELTPDNIDGLQTKTLAIRHALKREGIRATNGDVIDHVELFCDMDPSESDTGAHSKNFVLCPGAAYDRSPCGTGTSAKVACLAADGRLAPGEVWRQESIIGSCFDLTYRPGRPEEKLDAGAVIPSVTGSAWVNAEATLIIDPTDPFGFGIRA